jgi:hypothetical protein
MPKTKRQKNAKSKARDRKRTQKKVVLKDGQDKKVNQKTNAASIQAQGGVHSMAIPSPQAQRIVSHRRTGLSSYIYGGKA